MDCAMLRGRRPFTCGLCHESKPLRLWTSRISSRPTPGLLASHRGVRCAALSDGSSQGTSAALNPTLMGEAASQMELPENPHARTAPALKTGRVDSSDVPHSKAESSWDEWLRHFDTMDELAEDAAHYQVELNTAVRQERYGDAARHKRKLQEIQAVDAVAAVQQQLQDALASEQYGHAAELRDRGLVGLAGWWAGKDGPQDFQGHLLHVKPEFGRWTGRIYMARDIAAMNGWRENRLLIRPDRAGPSRGGADSSSAGLGSGTIGTPMMEVFVRQQSATGSSSGSGTELAQQLVPGRLVHQAVALRPPASKSSAARSSGGGKGGAGAAEGRAGGAAKLDPASVVRLSIHVARDGSARISVLPPKPVKSEFNSWEEEEMRATMAALAGGDLKPAKPRDRSPARPSPTSSLDDFQRLSDDDDEDILTELTRIPAQVAMQGRDRFTFTVLEDGAATSSSASGMPGADASSLAFATEDGDARASGSSIDLPRWAAVPIDDDDSSGDEGEASAAQHRSTAAAGTLSDSEVPIMEVEVEVVEEDVGRTPVGRRAFLDAVDESAARAAARLEAEDEEEDDEYRISGEGEEDDDGEDGLEVSFDMLSTGYGKLDAVATSVSDAEEQQITIEIPVGRLIRQQQRAQQEQQRRVAEEELRRMSGASASGSGAGPTGQGAGAAGGHAAKDTFDRLAERVAQLQTERAKRPVPPAHLAVALRTLAQRLVNGELAADGSSSATTTVPSPAVIEAQKAAAARLQAAASPLAPRSSSSSASAGASSTSSASSTSAAGARRVAYSRIPTNLPRSDPFCGLYLGAFGPHGPELIQLSRTLQDGEEMVCATKVTGDPNVPAGEVSFRAKVGRRHRLDSRDVYPEDLGIMARYKGEGRVAMAGYKSPRWVDGELLVFSGGGSGATGGAELGFVWSVPGEKRFLILLNKLDLKECEK